MAKKVIAHVFQAPTLPQVAKRFLALRDAHARASDCLWAGMVAAEFTDAELAILPEYLSRNDHPAYPEGPTAA